ncbi:MAG: hypothetical protein ABH858_00730 [Candidatus Omnitrophota bacterium]
MIPKDKRREKLLGEMLVEYDVIDYQKLEKALGIQRKEGGRIGDILVKLGYATEEEIVECVSLQRGFPYLPLENCEIVREVLNMISKDIAEKYCCLPIDRIGNVLTVAMANPLDTELLEYLKKNIPFEIQCFISIPSDIRNAIGRSYKQKEQTE